LHYYKNRTETGKVIAKKLFGIDTGNVAVIALSRGAIVVGAEIAKKVHASLFIFTTDDVANVGDNPGSAIFSGGAFSYNTAFSLGELEEDKEALRFFTDKRHMDEYQALNKVAGKNGIIPKELLRRHTVILVSDGLHNALSLQIAAEFLRPIEVKKVVLTTPVASAEAVDKMHVLVDQIFCLSVVENYIATNHYYENNDIPDDKTVLETMQNIVLNWPDADTK
jgi:putative phosphoribosyl transferase